MADFPNDPNQSQEPSGYVCPNCRKVTFGDYKPYCGECGSEMPSQVRLQVTGLATYPWEYGRPIRDIEKIAEFLERVGNTRFWLQAYRPSFRASEIRFSESNGDVESHALISVWTQRIKIPVGHVGWRGVLKMLGNRDVGCTLIDDENDVEVCAGSILLFTVDRSLRFAW